MKKVASQGVPVEVEALGKVVAALQPLDDTQRSWVIASAVTNLNVKAIPAILPGALGSQANTAAINGGAATSGDPLLGEPGSRGHARTFIRQKAPQSDVQRVACLAFYLDRYKGLSEFKGKDIHTLNTLVAGPKFNITRAIDNATRRSHYLSNAGASKKQIAPLGEDVVDALPNQQRVTDLETAAAGNLKRRGAKKKKRKHS